MGRGRSKSSTAEAPAVIDLAETRLRYVTVHGYRRAYRSAGTGPVLLLVHGIGDSSESWLPVMAALARHHTVIAPDLLGHGAPDKPSADYAVAAYANGMRDLLDVLGFDTATLVGHSPGAAWSQFAYQFPERCERLVLVASGGAGRDVSPLLRLASAPLATCSGSAPLAAGPAARADRPGGARPAGRRPAATGRMCPASWPGCPMVLPGGFTRTLRSVVTGGARWSPCSTAATWWTPSLPVVWGDRDGVIRPATRAAGTRGAARQPGSRSSPRRYFPHHDDPDRFVGLMRQFVATTEPARHDRDAWRAPAARRPIRPGWRPPPGGRPPREQRVVGRARRRAWSSTSVS